VATRLSVNGKLEHFICSKETCYNKELGKHCRDLEILGSKYTCKRHDKDLMEVTSQNKDAWTIHTGRRCNKCHDSEVPK
jgi:hypothetical protein